MMTVVISFDQIVDILGNKFGILDIACPKCGPERRGPANQRRKVLRIWRTEEAFATFYCSRCEARGHVRRDGAARPAVAAKAHTAVDHAKAADRQRVKAAWLWQQRQSLAGSLAETYLRKVRGYGGPLPATIGFLPARGDHSAAMISVLAAGGEVRAVHLTKLAPDGRKAGTDSDKIVIGSPRGCPISLMPINDGLGLLIAEGIEEALSGHEATGLGAWAAGSAPLLPYLAEVVPHYVECVTILVDDDKAGRRKSGELAEQIERRGIETRLFFAERSRAA